MKLELIRKDNTLKELKDKLENSFVQSKQLSGIN